MISLCFILITLVIYCILWKEHNTHGVTQFSFFVALALFYLTEGSRIILKLNGLHIEPKTSCFVHGY
jgi:hypothetical protein